MFENPTIRSLAHLFVRFALISISLLIVIGLGLGSKLYTGPFARWVTQDLNGVFYAIAWCFGLALVRPGASSLRLASVAVAICFGLEFLQLWHPILLETWRAQPLGHMVLGSSFAWLDLPYYVAGGILASGWLSVLPRWPRPAMRPREFTRPYGVPA